MSHENWSQTSILNNRMIICTSLHFSYALNIVQIRCRLSLVVMLTVEQTEPAYPNACFNKYFCSGVIRQHSACRACAHALCILNGIKACTAQSISIYHRTTCMLWSDRERTNIRRSHMFTHISCPVAVRLGQYFVYWNFMYTRWVLSPSYDNCQVFLFFPPLGITLLFHSPTTAHTQTNLISSLNLLRIFWQKKSFLCFWCWCTNTDVSPSGQSST